uniref:Chaperonin-60kD, ch60, putative n=1 Tax=Arundo donax TaxID=35708 RepID=A0A0A9CHD6_ARUDO
MPSCPQKSIPLICGIRLAILAFVAESSATAASVVVISNETLAASWSAVRITFTGSMMPALIMSTYSPFAAS